MKEAGDIFQIQAAHITVGKCGILAIRLAFLDDVTLYTLHTVDLSAKLTSGSEIYL